MSHDARMAFGAVLGLILAAGCGLPSEVGVGTIEPCLGAKTAPAQASAAAPTSTAEPKSGEAIWAEQCSRCHNLRSPSQYNDAQWDVAMMHMRVRAKLTADDYRAILKVLKSGRE